jgi:D-3-phosphoglycerate dehydrogenase
VATPHLGASTEEAQLGVASDVAQQIVAILGGAPARWAVNAPTVLPEEMQALQPYLEVAYKLGRLCSQAGPTPARALDLEFTGELARHDSSYLTAEAINGMLGGYVEDRINVVNALLVAEAHGIEVRQLRAAGGGPVAAEFPDLLTLTVVGESGERFSAAAAVLPQGPRIVRLGGFVIDLVPEGRFLVTYHDDRPLVIGRVGTILGEANINIASLHLGRDAPRGHAVMIVQVDDEVGDEVMERLRGVAGMSGLRLVQL